MRKKRLVIGIIGVAIVLTVLGTTVAYFVTNINDENKEVLTVNTDSLSLIFDDNSDGVNTSLLVGESVTKELKMHNNGTLPVTTNLNWYDLTNTYLPNSLSYKLEFKDSEAGTYQVIEAEEASIPKSLKASEATILKNITIGPEETYYYKITITLESLENMNQENDRDAGLATRFSLGDYKEIKVNFAEPATTDEGLYAMEDDYGTSYYYRGAVENNYVEFGGFYWRIIRFNGDGSMRMIYDGTQAYANGVADDGRVIKTNQIFNTYNNGNRFVGYMYGSTSTTTVQAQENLNSSAIKNVVDKWYEDNILVNEANKSEKNETGDISKYLADVIFCNDRTIPGKDKSGWVDDTGLGSTTKKTAYGAFPRLGDITRTYIPKPTFKCPDNDITGDINNDKFTVSDTEKGNGALKYPIGLITGDEIDAAGGGIYYTANNNFYLYKSSTYVTWSMTPCYFKEAAAVYTINVGGGVRAWNVKTNAGAVAPVINIKAEYVKTMTGNGTMDSPYQILGVQ